MAYPLKLEINQQDLNYLVASFSITIQINSKIGLLNLN